MAPNLTRWLKTGSNHSHRGRGDAARDERDWLAAENAYRRHLASVPEDFDIWVQFGHVSKEQEKWDQAEDAYRSALTLNRLDADANLHLGHLLKSRGRTSEALEMFQLSFDASPTGSAFEELTLLRGKDFLVDDVSSLEIQPGVEHTTLVEIDDLFVYLQTHKTLSGIQRVQVGVIEHILAQADLDITHFFVLNPVGNKRIWNVGRQDLAEIVSYLGNPQIDHARLKALIIKAKSAAVLIKPMRGQTYLILGAFWVYGSIASRYAYLKTAGVKIGAYIYDLIPITHSEYCVADLTHEFTLSIGDGLAIFDFALTISEFTEGELRRYIAKYDLPLIPIKTVPLAHSQIARSSELGGNVWGPQIYHLKDIRFVMMVSTIEARKNHTYLISAWKQLIDEGLDPPDLVFVGRVGWRVSSLMELLEGTDYLDGRVHIVHDLSDADLQTLYHACLYTAFPSFVEGWGLPVGESLAQGRPCVASSTSSIPEVGGSLVDYVDPQNLRDGIEKLRRMTFDHSYRAERTQQIADNFKPRSWRDVGANLLKVATNLRASIESDRDPYVVFAAGEVFEVGSLARGGKLPTSYPCSPKRLILEDSWYGIETIGCWMNGSHGSIKFRSDLPAGTEVLIYLKLNGAPWADESHKVVLSSKPIPSTQLRRIETGTPVRQNRLFLARLSSQVNGDGTISVHFALIGSVSIESDAPDARRFVVGLSSVAYAARLDHAMRSDISEDFVFDLLESLP